jgi:hypothetical protein
MGVNPALPDLGSCCVDLKSECRAPALFSGSSPHQLLPHLFAVLPYLTDEVWHPKASAIQSAATPAIPSIPFPIEHRRKAGEGTSGAVAAEKTAKVLECGVRCARYGRCGSESAMRHSVQGHPPRQCRYCWRPATADGAGIYCTECVGWHITDEGRAPWETPEGMSHHQRRQRLEDHPEALRVAMIEFNWCGSV